MAFAPGHKKFGGRQKGTPNKPTTDLFEICRAKGINVFEAMLDQIPLIQDPFAKLTALEKIDQYLYSKRKALEVSHEFDEDLAQKATEYSQLTKEEQIEMMEKELKRLKG
jgi:hypothetical protein